jgi:Ca2+-transporting ATPase
LSVAAVVLCLVLAVVRWRQGHGWVDAVVSAVTLAVAALPEEFPVAFTFFLGAGIYRLARRQALVRRAVSVENVGRVTTICADKTGTLTEGRLSVTQLVPAEGHSTEQLLQVGAGASREEAADPLDPAILGERSRLGLAPLGTRVAVFPFTEERRRETAIWREGTELVAATKGSPELVIGLCALNTAQEQRWLERASRLAAEGSTPIGCAVHRYADDRWLGG